jgi:hypothetical protein
MATSDGSFFPVPKGWGDHEFYSLKFPNFVRKAEFINGGRTGRGTQATLSHDLPPVASSNSLLHYIATRGVFVITMQLSSVQIYSFIHINLCMGVKVWF